MLCHVLASHYISHLLPPLQQHELETSNRKTPWSVRVKRDHAGPLTPVSASTQRRQQAGPSALGDSHLQTPSRPRYSKGLPDSPRREHRKKIINIPESPPKRTAKLPGFVNAFEPTTPQVAAPRTSVRFALSQASQASPGKGKDKERAPTYDYGGAQGEDLFFNPPADDYAPRPISQPNSSPMEEVREEALIPTTEISQPRSSGSAASSTTEPRSSPPNDDVQMNEDLKQPDLSEPVAPLSEPDWTAEVRLHHLNTPGVSGRTDVRCTQLHRIVLTHQHHSAKELSLQLLIDHPIPSTAPLERAQLYTAYCTRLLQSLGTANIKFASVDETIDVVGEALTGMGRVLCSVGSVRLFAHCNGCVRN